MMRRPAIRSAPPGAPALPLRPRKLRADKDTLAQLSELGELQCGLGEVALALSADEASVSRLLAESKTANTVYSAALCRGLVALRRTQFKLAESNAAMAIFLGKTYLGQDDRRESEQSGAIDVSQASQRVRDKLAALVADVATRGDRQGD
jgi:hypothetical protein